MRDNLAQMWLRAARPRRKEVAFRAIQPPSTLASDLYASAYGPVLAAWADAVEPIMAAYSRALAMIATDSATDAGAAIDNAEQQAKRLIMTMRLRTEAWAVKVERWQRGKWRDAVLTATKVDVQTMIGPTEMQATIQTTVEANVALIKSVSDQARGRISDAVFRGLRERKKPDEVAKEIREAVDMCRRRARNIAADQLVKISASLGEERRREAGISTWEWVSSHKAHPRPEHARRDGKRYDDNVKDGDHKPPQDRPGQLPFCGCTERAVLSVDSEF